MSNLHFITIISSVILVISMLGYHGRCEARSLSSVSVAARFLPQSYVKRNSWWSKKSLDNLPGNIKENLESSDHANCESIIEIMKCYSSNCVTDFVLCTKNAETEDVYGMCKVEHGICAARCFGTDLENRK